jgi:hypothetical protein
MEILTSHSGGVSLNSSGLNDLYPGLSLGVDTSNSMQSRGKSCWPLGNLRLHSSSFFLPTVSSEGVMVASRHGAGAIKVSY